MKEFSYTIVNNQLTILTFMVPVLPPKAETSNPIVTR